MHRDSLPAQSLATQYREACRQTDALFALVRPSFLTARPVRERHRLLFYIGHLEAFDWNLLAPRLLRKASFNPAFDRLFAFGIDPVGGSLPTDRPEDWPTMAEIYAYRDAVRVHIEAAIPDVDFSCREALASEEPASDADPATLLQVAIEHRQMHAETLAYLLHQMPLEQKQAPTNGDSKAPNETSTDVRATAGRESIVRVPAGHAFLGLSRDANRGAAPVLATTALTESVRPFGWDNEFDGADVAVAAFDIDRYMVRNADYLVFVEAGAYHDRRWWSDADWAWRVQEGLAHPAFWERDTAGMWWQRTMFERVPLPLDWPVYVSHAEAAAYARFVDKRLPSEAEWLHAAQGAATHDAPPIQGNFDFRRWDPAPVDAYPDNHSLFGVVGQFGNGWEWTADAFAPFAGFKPFSFYAGYSADFFDGQHFVMKGGSPRTAARMLRPSFRNWFQGHYPYVYAGFRCVRTVA